MAKFVFISIPLRSHANPTFPIVQELVARGEEVIYYLTAPFKQAVEATGATFRSYESKIEQINKTATTSGKPVGLPMYMLDESLFVIPQILEDIRAEQPDCIVYEAMSLSGRLIAEILQVPAVNFRMIFAFSFVGSAIAPREEENDFPFAQLAGQSVLYISHGTVYNDRPDFFNQCIAAFADTPWKVVMSIGNNVDQGKLAAIPSNFIVRTYVPQLEVLKYTKVCITHGSMTTLMEAFAQAVPLVVVPQATSDVTVNAMRVDELGLGIMLAEKALTAESLRGAVARISNDPAFYARALQMQNEIQGAGGYKRAASVLQEFVKVHI